MAAMVLAACSPATKTAGGVLTNVEATGLSRVEAITLRGDDGTERRFQVAPEAAGGSHPVSPSHLRQHMTYGDRVLVHYRDDAGAALAFRIDDVP